MIACFDLTKVTCLVYYRYYVYVGSGDGIGSHH